MTGEVDAQKTRIAPLGLPESYALPGRPSPSDGPVGQDAYRQTQFILAADLSLLRQAMDLQLRVLSGSKAGKYRTPAWAGLAGLWSRAFGYMGDSCALITRAAYPSVFPILKSACDCISAQQQLVSGDMEQFMQWFTRGITQNREFAAFDIPPGTYRAAGAIASDALPDVVYRAVSSLSLPHFGSTALLTASESSPQRYVLFFGDRAFHLAWAELSFGFLLSIARAQLDLALSHPEFFPPDEQRGDEFKGLCRRIDALLSSSSRARIEEVADSQGNPRFLLHNFRRLSGAAPRKLIL